MSDPGNPNIVVVDQYANGYDQPPTAVNVATFPVDPNNLPAVGAHVTSVMVNQQPYSINTAGGNTIAPAKISNNASAPITYQVDIYGNGYSSAPTQTAVNAIMIDTVSTNFSVGDQVSIFIAGSNTWIVSSKPYSNLQNRLIIPGRIISYSGEGGVYTWQEVDHPGGNILAGALMLNATEFTNSTQVVANTDVLIVQFSAGNYYFFYPLGANA